MAKKGTKKKMVGPWRSLHAAIWLIGIALLITYDWWWPGILVLVAISGVYEGFLQRYTPEAYVEESHRGSSSSVEATASLTPESATPPDVGSTSMPEHRLELLPAVCPNCNGPIRGHEIRWSGPQSANCPYCGSNLPMKISTS